ncbi:sigma-70 family RNA polymerase sigma factor [Niveispirillum irakense]|uniref:sigma-70 family RNA polymerase sigma factor n=1 Tax=Niveispirillum irakense TaxID=34011 RepID=UPI0003FA6474|nr:sigma-70 family RNA polymerase sigma factor [Niveispirillum irakense]
MVEGAAAAAISKLYTTHAHWLRDWLRLRTRCASRAADLTQDTFCRLLEQPRLPPLASPRGYLATVARRLLIDDIRRREIERAIADICALQNGEADLLTPERIAEAAQFLDMVARLLDTLPEQARTAFLLRRVEGLSQQEVATALGVSLATVKRHIALSYASCLSIMEGA